MVIGVRAAALIFGSLILVGGCGQGASSTVTGSVTYNGAPVETGVVSFTSDDAASSFAADIVSGQYTAKEARPGSYKATVQATSAAAKATTSRESFQQQGQTSAGKQESPNYIPENAEGNGQTVEIKDGDQTLDFALTGPPRK